VGDHRPLFCREIPYKPSGHPYRCATPSGLSLSHMQQVQNGFIRSLLRVPLFYKIMVANLAIMIVVIVAGAGVATRLDTEGTLETILLFAFLAGIAVVLANAVILRLALLPLERLEAAAEHVQAGDLTMRATPSPLADREMHQLIKTFNGMLDSLAELRSRQRELSIRAVHAAEEERKRVSIDLHDKTAQTLAGLLVQLSLAKSIKDPDKRAEMLKEASEQATAAMEEVYRVVQVLRPPALELLGLRGAIEAYARTLSEGGALQIDVAADDVKGALNEEAEIATYRIVQEALSNVIRHSGATRAGIHLSRTSDGVVVTIQDNGVGFATEETMRSSQSLGLFGMQERASYLGGHVEIRSTSAGTTVEVQIPVTEEI
jgi:two-component system, NarL family, sensor histidine kinase UhpB